LKTIFLERHQIRTGGQSGQRISETSKTNRAKSENSQLEGKKKRKEREALMEEKQKHSIA